MHLGLVLQLIRQKLTNKQDDHAEAPQLQTTGLWELLQPVPHLLNNTQRLLFKLWHADSQMQVPRGDATSCLLKNLLSHTWKTQQALLLEKICFECRNKEVYFHLQLHPLLLQFYPSTQQLPLRPGKHICPSSHRLCVLLLSTHSLCISTPN